MRLLLALFLCISLAATSVSSAVMHAEMQGAVEMTICADAAGSGVATVLFDATGKPIPHPHKCPDCLGAMASALLPVQADVIAPQTRATLLHPAAQASGTGRPSPDAMARGPPDFL